MEKDVAIIIAKSTMDNYLRSNYTEHGMKHRYRDGRWDVYSMDIAQWHILISDNAGKIIGITER